MRPNRNSFVIMWILWVRTFSRIAEANERHKRELKFPEGSSFVAAVALTSFLPKGPTDGLAHILEFDLGIPFPEHFDIEKKKAQKKVWKHFNKQMNNKMGHRSKPNRRTRSKRNLKEEQKKNLRLKIEDAITRVGFNGFGCTSRFLCELQTASSKNSLLEELLLALFTTSEKPDDKECEMHNKSCPISLLHVIMHSEQISPPQMI